MNFNQALEAIKNKQDLDQAEAEKFLSEILDNNAISDIQIADALTALT